MSSTPTSHPTGPTASEEVKPADWGIVILGLIALFLAEASASALGMTPESTIGGLEAKQLEAVLDAVLAPNISAELVTWSGFAFAGVSSLLVVWAGVQVPKEKSLAVSLMTGVTTRSESPWPWRWPTSSSRTARPRTGERHPGRHLLDKACTSLGCLMH